MRLKVYEAVGEIDSLPGCTQIAVSHSVFLPKGLRGQSKGTVAGYKRDAYLRDSLGYDYALCTVASSNDVEKRCLITRGWKKLDNFMSTKTDHAVEIWGKSLNETGQRMEVI